jgi:hypothetical protein
LGTSNIEFISLHVVVTGSSGLHFGLTGAGKKEIVLALKSYKTSEGISDFI